MLIYFLWDTVAPEWFSMATLVIVAFSGMIVSGGLALLLGKPACLAIENGFIQVFTGQRFYSIEIGTIKCIQTTGDAVYLNLNDGQCIVIEHFYFASRNELLQFVQLLYSREKGSREKGTF